MTKRVRWSTITIHEFGVGHGGSAVPKTGPSIGLSRKPEFTWSTKVGAMAREGDGVRRFTSQERIALLRDAGFSRDSVDAFSAEAKRVRRSRELYYSSEMKQLRRQRKRAKLDKREAASDVADEPRDVQANHHDAQTTVPVKDDEQEEKATTALRMEATPSPTTSLVPPALPVSPCCS